MIPDRGIAGKHHGEETSPSWACYKGLIPGLVPPGASRRMRFSSPVEKLMT